jgi:outer membrane protein OmpA-like peptidoglycan-associated protein
MEGGQQGAGFWPAYVDALTNVIIALVFVVVVLAVSLSFSAQMAAKKVVAKITAAQAQKAVANANATAAPGHGSVVQASTQDAVATTQEKTTISVQEGQKASAPKVEKISVAQYYFNIEYPAASLLLDAEAEKQLVAVVGRLKKRLGDAPDGAQITLVASGPQIELSENQRAGYIRAMAIRNLLIEQGIAANRISTRFNLQARPSLATISVDVGAVAP